MHLIGLVIEITRVAAVFDASMIRDTMIIDQDNIRVMKSKGIEHTGSLVCPGADVMLDDSESRHCLSQAAPPWASCDLDLLPQKCPGLL